MEERGLMAKEMAWNGRGGTMELRGTNTSNEKESVRLRAKTNKLPPLEGGSRSNSAPDVDIANKTLDGGDGRAEATVMNAISKARSKQNKAKKASKAEMNLFQSPFAQPLLKEGELQKAMSPG